MEGEKDEMEAGRDSMSRKEKGETCMNKLWKNKDRGDMVEMGRERRDAGRRERE